MNPVLTTLTHKYFSSVSNEGSQGTAAWKYYLIKQSQHPIFLEIISSKLHLEEKNPEKILCQFLEVTVKTKTPPQQII